MGTPPLQKNGRDQRQDGELRELKEELRKFREADMEAHTSILDKLSILDKDVLIAHVRDEEKDKAETKLRRQIAALAFFFVTTASGLVSWGVMEARDLHQRINDNTAHFREFQAIGIEWGDAIDERAEGFKEDIRQLRRTVHEHQRNKSEHLHKD